MDRLLVVLGYPSMVEAADAVPALLAATDGGMVACEGLDARIVDLVRAKGSAVPELPAGSGWLFVEVVGAEAQGLVAKVVAEGGALGHRLVSDPAEAAALWRIREDGAGLAARSLKTPAYSGWEDAAVPPDRLGAWLRDFDELLKEHGLDGVPYGHFGDGCVHVRIDFPFQPGDDGSATVFRDFLTACALKLRDHRGSLSGEHGDGRARSELLPLMYDAESIRLFAAVKAICDPRNLLNPGNLVDPAPLDADLRPVRARQPVLPLLQLPHDGGQLGDAVHRCTGVGKCVAASTTGVMCPSYLATRDEKDSTRGRSRVLQEAIDGSLVQGFADPAVAEALDLCLACKGCASDCPTGVDMATYKSEALHQKHDVQGVRRPRSHRLLGRLPQWADRAAPVAPLANRMMRLGPVARLAKATAGIDQRRSIPAFARKTLRRSVPTSNPLDGRAPDVWIWADSFSDHFFPANGHAAIRYLESAGLTARVIPDDACCGLTWITTGQLDQAQRIMARTVATLAPYVESGVPGDRPGAVLPGHAAQRRRRAHRQHPRRAQPRRARRARAAAAARPHRGRGGRPAALPPPRRHRLGRRPAAARARRRDGHPGRRLLRPGRQLRHGEGPLRGLGRGRGDAPAARPCAATPARSCSPTACPAGSSSTTWPAYRPCTWRSCWLRPSGSGRRTPSPRSPRRPWRSPRAGVRRRRRGSR